MDFTKKNVIIGHYKFNKIIAILLKFKQLFTLNYIEFTLNNSKTIPVIAATASGSYTKEELFQKRFSDCIFKPFSKQDLWDIADRNIADKEENDEKPDFTAILVYGDEVEMLDKVISVTEQDMQNFKDAGERKDLKVLDELIHHLRSSWGILNTDKPLWELHELLKGSTSYSDKELDDAIQAVLEKGDAIIRCANEKKKEVANGLNNCS